MAIELFDAELVIARITDQVTGLKQLGGSADFLAARKGGPITPPAAFVVQLTDRPALNDLATVQVSQRDGITFAVIFAIHNLRDALGREAHVELKALREAVMTALIGWEPTTDYDVITYAPSGGRLLMFADQVLWWQDDFATALYLRSV